MTKPKIEVIPIEQAIQRGWYEDNPYNLEWVYRVTSPYDPDNHITGLCNGARHEVKKKATEIGKRFIINVQAMRRGRAAVNMGIKFNQHPEGP